MPNSDKEKAQSPTAVATAHIKAHTVSLQHQIAELLETIGTEYIRLQAKTINKVLQIDRLEGDDALIPHSAKSNFTLRVSKQAEQEADFIELKTSLQPLTEQFQQDCKRKIIAAAKIEVRVLRKALAAKYATGLRIIAKAFLVADGLDDTDEDQVVNSMLDRYHESMLTHSFCTLAEFRDLYQGLHSLENLP